MTQKERNTILAWSDEIMQQRKTQLEILTELYDLYSTHGGGTSSQLPSVNKMLMYLLTSEAEGMFEKVMKLYNRYNGLSAQIAAVEDFGRRMTMMGDGKKWQIEKER